MQSQALEIFYLFFQGILTFQALVFVVLYFITRRKDLLYYSLFLFCAAAYFFINAPYTFLGIPEEKVWNAAWYAYTNTPVIIIENLFYLLFLKTFFADITHDKTVSRVFRFTLWLIPFIVLVFILFTILKMDKQFIFYTVKMITVIPAISVAYILLKKKPPFATLVANGLLCTIIGTSITVFMIILGNYGVRYLFTIWYPLFFIRLGILGDMIFYLAAILKKWHYQEKQLAVEKIESRLASEQLRNKISGELHDDLGSTLSGISMYGYMTSDLLQSGQYEKAKESLGVIQRSVSEMALNLDDLVWTINPRQDSFEMLVERLEQYGTEICAAKGISFKVSCHSIVFKNKLPIEARHHIYLFGKEAINNAVKYSEATAIELIVKEAGGKLIFSVIDNGKGFDIDTIKSGNGLVNMQKRADEIGAKLLLQSKENKGTSVSLQCKIT